MINPKRWRLPLAAIVAVFSLAAATGAMGAPPTSVSGTVGNTSATFNNIRSADGNLIIDVTATAAYTGDLVGTSTINGTLIVTPTGARATTTSRSSPGPSTAFLEPSRST